MNIEEFRKVIREIEECHPEWDYGIEQCWKKEIALLTEDIPSTIEFLRNECTADEYTWISEVLDDIVEIAPSRELVQEYKALMKKFPEQCSTYYIAGCIEQIERMLDMEC